MDVLDHVVRHDRAERIRHVDAVVVAAVHDLAAAVDPVSADLDAVHRGIPGLVVRERHARLAQVLVGHVGVEEP